MSLILKNFKKVKASPFDILNSFPKPIRIGFNKKCLAKKFI